MDRTMLRCILLAGGLFLSGCVAGGGVQMVATPNLFLQPDSTPYANVPREQQMSAVDMIYATDRVAIDDPTLFYGHGRSTSLAFGVTRLEMGRLVCPPGYPMAGRDWEV